MLSMRFPPSLDVLIVVLGKSLNMETVAE